MTDHNHDIEKYLKGELSPAEMNALEKRALDDPFLADALEGAESINDLDLSADLHLLKRTLDERIQDKRKTLTPWIWAARIAAGLLLLVVASYVIFTLTSTDAGKSAENLALNKPATPSTQTQPSSAVEKEEAESPLPAISNPDTGKSIAEVPSTRQTPPVIEVPSKGEKQLKDVTIDKKLSNISETQPSSQGVTTPAEEVTVVSGSDDVVKQKSETVASGAAREAKSRTRKSDKEIVKVLKGTVTDLEDGTPLPGVTVSLKGTDIGTFTDSEGNYELSLPKSTGELNFSFIGLQEVQVPLTTSDTVNVKMNADFSELSEIVVVGFAPANGDLMLDASPTSYELAEPRGGRKAYKNYLVTNMHYPQLAIENKIEGKVTIHFTVEPSGVLNDFKVVKGIGYGCDEEVLRLVKDGPKWTPSKANDVPVRGKVKVRLRFRLPG